MVLVFESACFGPKLEWEYVESRGKEFPHLYDECLRRGDVSEVVSLVVEEGRFVWGRN